MWPPWGRDRSPGDRIAAVGAGPVHWVPIGRLGIVAVPLGTGWVPWGRCRCPGSWAAAVGATPVPWSPCGRRGNVAGPLGTVKPPCGRGRSPGSRVAEWERNNQSVRNFPTSCCPKRCDCPNQNVLDEVSEKAQLGETMCWSWCSKLSD